MTKTKSNMFDWIDRRWNPVKGRCMHDCSYCYMKQFELPSIYLDNQEFRENLGQGKTIFVGSGCDMFAEDIKDQWIKETIRYINKFPGNTYLFHTKNPARMKHYYHSITAPYILGVTIETNRNYNLSKAPTPYDRYQAFKSIKGQKTVTIEPIMDFDLDILISWLKEINPDFISIGADSKGHGLLEPSKEKTTELINELKRFTSVEKKRNLDRILEIPTPSAADAEPSINEWIT